MGDNNFLTRSNKCRLCLTSEANHKKSHLITEWLFKKVKGNQGGAKIYPIHVIDNKAVFNRKPSQDALFEKFVLCKGCESYLGFIERYIKNNFYTPFRTPQNFRNQEEFRTITLNPDTITYCEKVNKVIFALFILCQFWRATLSRKPAFSRLACNIVTIENFRKTVLSFKSSTQTDLIQKTQQKAIQNFKYLILLLNNDTKISPQDTSIQICSTADKQIHRIEVNDLKFYITDNCGKCLYKNDIATNTGMDKVKVIHISDSIWKEWDTGFLREILGFKG